MSRQLTEPEAWREIARRIAEGVWSEGGLCCEMNDLFFDKHISEPVLLDMERRIDQHLDAMEHDCAWAYKAGTEPEARILAALWLALEAEEEHT